MHFFLLGAVIFVFAGRLQESTVSPDRIVVGRGQIEQLARTFERTWQRAPTHEELAGLVDDWIRTEIAVRQARAMGLDDGDLVIRRRLRQKLEFLTEDVAQAAPTDDELRDHLANHANEFRTPTRFTFRQIYFSPEARPDPVGAARAVLRSLARGAADPATAGDRLLVPDAFADAPDREVASLFGQPFVDALATAPQGRWSGPITSGYGLHLVLLEDRRGGVVPPLEEIRPAVEREWQSARRARTLDEAYRRMRERYEVLVEWTTDAPGERAPAS